MWCASVRGRAGSGALLLLMLGVCGASAGQEVSVEADARPAEQLALELAEQMALELGAPLGRVRPPSNASGALQGGGLALRLEALPPSGGGSDQSEAADEVVEYDYDHGFSEPESLDLTGIDIDLKGFAGGFMDGKFGYLIPHESKKFLQTFVTVYCGKVVRFDLATFGDVSVLDLRATDPDLRGFVEGFTDTVYGYLIPSNNGHPFGKVARFDLATFGRVQVLDLTLTDPDLKGFHGGFSDGSYGYVSPNENDVHHLHNHFGKVARFDLQTFRNVEVLDLTIFDSDLKGFVGGFHDGNFGYVVPYDNGDPNHPFGKVARFDLPTFRQVAVLDLTIADPELKGFHGGFSDSTFGYVVPYKNAKHQVLQPDSFSGKLARFDLETFSSVTVLDLTGTSRDLRGFAGGFSDGTYGYAIPNDNGAHHFGKVARFALDTFDKVEVLDLTLTDPLLKGFYGGFHDDAYGYVVPSDIGNHKVARFSLCGATSCSPGTSNPLRDFLVTLACLAGSLLFILAVFTICWRNSPPDEPISPHDSNAAPSVELS